MKHWFVALVIGFVVYYVWKYYHSPQNTATGNTNPDASKNVQIANPVLTGGSLIPVNLPAIKNGVSTEVMPASGAPLPATAGQFLIGKMLTSNASGLSADANIRTDLVDPQELARSQPINTGVFTTEPLVIGSLYGQNLSDPSLKIDILPSIIQTTTTVPPALRVNDNQFAQPTSTIISGGESVEPLIPIRLPIGVG